MSDLRVGDRVTVPYGWSGVIIGEGLLPDEFVVDCDGVKGIYDAPHLTKVQP